MGRNQDKGQYKVGKKYRKASHNCWYCMVEHPDGRRQERRLDPDEEAAEGIRQSIIEEVKKAGRPSLDCTVDHLIQLFLTHVEANNARDTYKFYKHFLASFKASIGTTLAVRDLGLHHVQNWLSKHYPVKGNQNTRHNAIAAIKRLFNWAVRDMGYFNYNPLSGLKKPQRTHRETCPSMAQWNQVLGYYGATDPFRELLTVMIDTGCRPQELRVLEARQLDLAAKPFPVIRFADGDIPGKKWGRDVRLTDRAVEILNRRALQNPQGPLFCNENGNPWTKDALKCRFLRLKHKERLSFKVSCYSARHSLATDLLDNGASAGAVAALLGHRDPTVVLKFYGKHIEQRAEHLQGLLDKARPPQPPQPQEPQESQGPQGGDENPQGLKVIGETATPKPEPESQKRDAG